MVEEISYHRMAMDDRDAVLQFLRAAYPDTPRQSDPEFWNWHYVDHPNSEPGAIPVWLAKAGTRIVGQLAAIPVELNVDESAVAAIWILDLMVDPEFRRRGVMKKLVGEANRSYEYMLGSATRRQHSAALLTSLGWTVFSALPRYHKILYPGSATRAWAEKKGTRKLVDVVFTPLRPGNRRLDAMAANVRQVDVMDAAFDELWHDCAVQWRCSITRSSDYLAWQFERQPGKSFEIIGYFENGKMLGYAVLFFRKPDDGGAVNKAAISDICYHPSNSKRIVDALIAAALKRAIQRRSGGLVTDALDIVLEERLRHFGFWPVKSGLEVMAIGPAGNDILYDPASWHLTRADSDISIFEEPNL